MIKEITVKGAVQGIGYRPFIAAKAKEHHINGYVKNMGAYVYILATGSDDDIRAFLCCIKTEVPPGGFILQVESRDLEPSVFISENKDSFDIIDSSELDLSMEIPVFLPDIGICDDCLREMQDSSDRRFGYPLISCAVCGPRLSILDKLPYDRITTTMKPFSMCPDCSREYTRGRRRYAQTISCHSCGPQMILKKADRRANTEEGASYISYSASESVNEAIKILSGGGIIALKGVSGYQLVCLPTRECAERLRRLKGREEKPFAVMFSTSRDIEEYCHVSSLERELLESSARPIVLLNKKKDLDPMVVKKSRYIGAFLPSAGIHRLLTDSLGPLIVTSANYSDQPIIINDEDIFNSELAISLDGILYHERAVNMPQDDSVLFVISDGVREYPQFVRRARGYAPLPIIIERDSCPDGRSMDMGNDSVVLSYGGDLKSCFAYGHHDRIMPSQYIGDLKDLGTNRSYRDLMIRYEQLFKQIPDILVCDMHPSYFSTAIAQEHAIKTGRKLLKLQHHAAHIYSVMAENSLTDCIGVSFDGTGYGTDGRIWGGEFLSIQGSRWTREGHLSYVLLPGGDETAKDAERVRFGYMHQAHLTSVNSGEDTAHGR